MKVYADNASSTQIRHEALGAMQESYEHYANPSCIHAMGQEARDLIEDARNIISKSINAKPDEIIFTSGGTESVNLAIQGFVYGNDNWGAHIITTSIEHAAVLNTAKHLYNDGYDVSYLPVDSNGIIDIEQLIKAIRKDTMLISIMFANNEIGSIQPIKEIGDIARHYDIRFHTDAVQAFGHCDIDVNELGIDMLSISGHKIYAPKGIGALYVKNDIDLIPLFHGGGQEYDLRSGTENVHSIVGFGKAVELLDSRPYLPELKAKLIYGVINSIPDVKLNTPINNSLPTIVNFSFKGIDGRKLVTRLNEVGIYASTGSACSSDIKLSSHVLTAIGVPDDIALGSVRFSFGMYNTVEDIDYILNTLPDIVSQLRNTNY